MDAGKIPAQAGGGGGSGSGAEEVQGNVAHDAVDDVPGLPVEIGYNAQDPTALPAAVAVGDRVRARGSVYGEIFAYLTRLISGENQTFNVMMSVMSKQANGQFSPSRFSQVGTFGATGEASVKASTGNVFAVYARNKAAAGTTRYLYLADKASAITTPGGAPTYVFAVAGDSWISLGEDFFSQYGINFAAGIRAGWSSTENTFTAVNEDVVVFVHYI